MESYTNNYTDTHINIVIFGTQNSGKKTFVDNISKISKKLSDIQIDPFINNLIRVRYSFKNFKNIILNFHLCQKTEVLIKLCEIERPFFIFFISKSLDGNLFDFIRENTKELSEIKYHCFIKNVLEDSSNLVAKSIQDNNRINYLPQGFLS
jgi:hypothetical protein